MVEIGQWQLQSMQKDQKKERAPKQEEYDLPPQHQKESLHNVNIIVVNEDKGCFQEGGRQGKDSVC